MMIEAIIWIAVLILLYIVVSDDAFDDIFK